jgi:hypothetical protein
MALEAFVVPRSARSLTPCLLLFAVGLSLLVSQARGLSYPLLFLSFQPAAPVFVRAGPR